MPGIQFTFEVNDTVSSAIEGIKGKIEEAFGNQETLAKFSATLGQSADTTKQMGDLAKSVFQQGWGESLGDVTDAISAVGSGVLDLADTAPADIERITKGTLDLANAMGVDVVDVTKAATQMMANGLAPNAQAALDIIAQGAQNGANRTGDLLDTLSEYSPSFSAIGVDGETALGMIKNAVDAGIISTDKAGDAINEFGIRVIDGSKGSVSALNTLGFNAQDMAEKIAGGGPAAKEATSQIIEALAGMTDPVAQETAGVALFGSMWEDSGAQAILSMDPVAAATVDLTGKTQKMGDTLHDTAANKVEAMQRSFDGWIQSLTESNGPLGDVMTWAQSFGPQVLTIGSQVGVAAMAISNMGIASKIAAAAQWALNLAMDANPIMLVVIAIAAIVGAFIWLWNTSDGFRQFWLDLWDTIKSAFSTAVDWITTKWSDLRDRVVGIFTDIKNWIGQRIADIKQFATDVKDWFTGRFQDIATFVSGIFRGISDTVTGIGSGIYNFVTGIFNWVHQRIDDLIGFIQSIPSRISGAIGSVSGMLDQAQSQNGLIGAIRKGLSYVTPYPFLASGGVVMPVPGGQPIMAGDGGEPEAVIPLSKWNSMTGGGGGGNVTVHVQGFVGNEIQLARAIQDVVGKGRRAGALAPGGF